MEASPNRYNQGFQSSQIEKFIILGNPNRHGVVKSANNLIKIIGQDRPIEFVETGQNPRKTFEKIYDQTLDPDKNCAIVVGGDGTIRNVFESLRIEDSFRSTPVITTKFVGGARDLNSNFEMRKSPYDLIDLILQDQLIKGEIHPIEAHINQSDIIRAYNVLGIGLSGLTAERINQMQLFKHRSPQMFLNGLIVAKTLLEHSSSFGLNQTGKNNIQPVKELIVTKGKRFAGFIKTTSKNLEPESQVHIINGVTFKFLIDLVLGNHLDSDNKISTEESQDFDLSVYDGLILQADGDTFRLTPQNKPIHLNLRLSEKSSTILTIKK
jgi:diacylglycerol kinase family enzyme